MCFITLDPVACMGSCSFMNLWNQRRLNCLSSEFRDISHRGPYLWSEEVSWSTFTPTRNLGLKWGFCSALVVSRIPTPIITSESGTAWLFEVPRAACWITKRDRCNRRRLPAIRYAAVRKKSRNWVRRRNFCSLKKALAMPLLKLGTSRLQNGPWITIGIWVSPSHKFIPSL